jgi:hypothetical protein
MLLTPGRCSRVPDVFVAFQHCTRALPHDWWSNTFRRSVADIGTTLLVLQPWGAPLPLTRSWCLWEIFCTVDCEVQLRIALSPEQSAELRDALVRLPARVLLPRVIGRRYAAAECRCTARLAAQTNRFDDIARALSRIDTRRAESFLPEDAAQIAAAVRASAGGFCAVNARIHGCLQAWLAREARTLVAERTAAHGAAHASTVGCTDVLIQLLLHQGAHEEAAAAARGALAARTAALGDAHAATLAAQHLLAMVLRERGAYAEAEPLLRAALTGRRAALGDAHADTCATLNYLGILLNDTGRDDEAAPLLRAAAAGRAAALGAEHPASLASASNLGILLCSQGVSDAAAAAEGEAMLRDVLERRRRTLGELHPQTLDSCHNLGYTLVHAGRPREAQPLLRAAAEGRAETLGSAHARTVGSTQLLARAVASADAAAATSMLAAASLSERRADKWDVLISYCVAETGGPGDRSVFGLQAALVARGFRVFVGESAIQAGASWPDAVNNGIQAAAAVIVLCSPGYADPERSRWTCRELQLAVVLNKPLVPVWHSGTYPPPGAAPHLVCRQQCAGGGHARSDRGYADAGVSPEALAAEVEAALARVGVAPQTAGRPDANDDA